MYLKRRSFTTQINQKEKCKKLLTVYVNSIPNFDLFNGYLWQHLLSFINPKILLSTMCRVSKTWHHHSMMDDDFWIHMCKQRCPADSILPHKNIKQEVPEWDWKRCLFFFSMAHTARTRTPTRTHTHTHNATELLIIYIQQPLYKLA